jgi:hypothetical protein
MHATEYKILNIFKKNLSKELATSEITKAIFPEHFNDINKITNDELSTKGQIKEAKSKKAKLHRQVLHHLNKLVSEDIILLNREGAKGEKFFRINLNEGEELTIGKQKRKILISKPNLPASSIDGYEQEGIITRFESNNWIEKLNSILVECSNFDNVDDLYQTISTCMHNVNDAIALNHFETLSTKFSLHEIDNLITNITEDCADYNKNVCFIIDFSKKKDGKKLISLIKNYFARFKSAHIRFIFEINTKELRNNSKFFNECIELFSDAQSNLYIKNQSIHSPPYFTGGAGPYTFNEEEWSMYQKEIQNKVKFVVCAQTAIAIDLKRFFEGHKNVHELLPFLIKIAKDLLIANSFQRTKSEDYFRNIIGLNNNLGKESFLFSRNLIRFWNYGWKEENIDFNARLGALKQSKKEIGTFCTSEETIYLSCGVPTRFKIAFSCAFKKFNKKIFGGEMFNKIIIKKLEDLYSDDLKSILEEKEKIFEIFDGGDRVRFFRNGVIKPQDIEREIMTILNTYKLPFFCYDFGGMQENIKLTSFIDN